MKEIVQDGAPVLRDIALPVREDLFGSAELKRLINDLTEALDKEPEGVAIAAPQIGVSYRLFLVRMDRTVMPPERPATSSDTTAIVTPEIEVFVNPQIIRTSRKRTRADEGCLSVKGVYGVTHRHERVTIRARREDGSTIERGAGGILAQIFEHEIDHLNGILFTDHAENLIHLSHVVDA